MKLFVLIVILFTLSSAQIGNDPGEFAEVKSLLNEIRTVSLVKHGQLFDYDPEVVKNQIAQATFDDGTEASVNRPYIDDLFENDIVLTLPQAKRILQEVKDEPRKRRPRQAQPGEKYFWKSTNIPFKFHWNDDEWQDLIRKAQGHIESETCMRFIENGTGPDFLLYTRGSGCWSNVGRVGGRQQISIGYGCDSLGVVAHETLHALALWHEQSRYDRDEHIEIAWKNIFRGTESNFEKRSPKNSENYNQPYDMGSVMHYGAKAFSSDWESYSILTKDPNYQQTIGQRVGISFKDAKMINTRYCSKICSRELECRNGGYTDPNNCNRCKCPDGFSGSLCQSIAVSNFAPCRGGELSADDQLRTLNSPPLESELRCYWRLKAPKDQRVEINVLSVSFVCDNACSSFLEVKYKKQKVSTGARFCCDAPKKLIVSEDEEVILIYKGIKELVKGWLGFKLTYRAVPSDGPDPSSKRTEEPVTETTTSVYTTTKSTTRRSTTTTTTESSNFEGKWSDWGGWSGCTATCGACGKKKRVRACYKGKRCQGESYEFATCGEQACAYPYKTTRCNGRLILPCDLLEKLDFGTTRLPSSVKIDDHRKNKERVARDIDEDLPFLKMTTENGKILQEIHREHAERKKRFVDGNRQLEMKIYCEKRFSYNCPTNLLTISMDYKNALDTITRSDTRLCCEGYVSRGGGICQIA